MRRRKIINNSFYNDLQEGWYLEKDHPIALLRAENALRKDWIASQMVSHQNVLDIGCGAGFLTNFLAQKGHMVTGVDLSETSLKVARLHDKTGSVEYIRANAYHLPFEKTKFDVVCATDILEHLEYPERLIEEASRVLRPGGRFFFIHLIALLPVMLLSLKELIGLSEILLKICMCILYLLSLKN